VSLRRAVTKGGGFSPVAAASFQLHEVIVAARATRRADTFLVGRMLLKHGGGGCGTVLLHVVRRALGPHMSLSPHKRIARRNAHTTLRARVSRAPAATAAHSSHTRVSVCLCRPGV
jgi:hypothetical protein